MKITIITDNKNSWIIPYAKELKKSLLKKYQVKHVYKHEDIETGDMAFFLSCEKIIKSDILKLNKHNIVIHESKLPDGKGWSPLSWQILEGKNNIPITLFEVEKKVDSGNIYLQDYIKFDGHELVDELRMKQGKKTINLILKFISFYPNIKGKKQVGKSTYYRKRTIEDSELNINKSIKELFNNLRIIDNERYPAFFKYKGHKYILKIYKDDNFKNKETI